MKKNVKLVLLIAVLALLGWGIWKAWSIYKVVQGIRENVPGVSMGSDGINLVKEDSQGNKFNVKSGRTVCQSSAAKTENRLKSRLMPPVCRSAGTESNFRYRWKN